MDKYTVRDYLVYFLTGLFLLLTLLYNFDIRLLEYFKITKKDVTDNPSITIFLLLPGFYFVGHIVHGIDLFLFKVGRFISDKYYKKLKNKPQSNPYVLRLLNFSLNGNRITGIIDKYQIEDFWKKYAKAQESKNISKADYWFLVNDLLKGIFLITIIWTIYYLFRLDWLNFNIFLIVSLIFWYRARHSATNFVTTVGYLHN